MPVCLRPPRLHLSSPPHGAMAPPHPGFQAELIEGYAPDQMIEDLRRAQAELEIQNQALRYSQQEAEGASERFATLFSNVPLALMVVDEEGLVIASNAMALRLFQPQEDDPSLTYLLPFVESGHADEVAVALVSAKAEGTSQVHELGFKCGRHGRFTGDLHIAMLENPAHELAHFICAIIDQGPLLAQRAALQESADILRQKNEELARSESRMATIIDSSLDAIVCVDGAQTISVFNPAAARLFMCPAAQALGTPLQRFLPELARRLAAHSMPNQAELGEFDAVTLSGEKRAVEVGIAIERRRTKRSMGHGELVPPSWWRERGPKPGVITTLFVRDLTHKKRAQAQQEALEQQLRESQKMQAMGTMAGGIAHDFNNILGAILGNVELARQDSPRDAPAQTSLLEIEKAGKRARDLVRQILTFSRNEAPRRRPVRLAELVADTARLVRVTLPPNVFLEAQPCPNDATILADTTQVEQALLNLCTNAILAVADQPGRVRIGVRSVVVAHPQCDSLGISAGRYQCVDVHDDGVGMDTATLGRIFEPFFTTRQVGQGTGLGLSVVHGVMRSHQGAIEVHSVPGQGSTFSLYFPSATLEGGHTEAHPAPLAEVQGRGQRVMYVDDDEALVFLVRRVLTRKGFAVQTYTNPQEALQALRDNPHCTDLLVTDYNMPGYSGVDLLRDAKALRPDLPVALASGYVSPEIEHSALARGASALIHKPNDVAELCDTVQKLLTSASAWA